MNKIDFALDATGDLVLVSDEKYRKDIKPITGAARIAQSLNIRLRTWMGEWYLNLNHGVPYISSVMGKQPQELVLSVFRTQISTVQGIQRIDALTLDLDAPSRLLNVAVSAVSAEGPVEAKMVIST